MAAYTDQFKRHSPFALRVGYLFRGRLASTIEQAAAVLVERDPDEAMLIAEAVSRAIDAEANAYGLDHTEHYAEQHPQLSAADLTLVREGAVGDLAEEIRDELGELGLFLGIELAQTGQDGADGGVRFDRAEALAVLSLWLAADCIDLIIAAAGSSWDRWGAMERYQREAVVLAMDSMAASLLAVEARERAVDRTEVEASGARASVIAEMVEREEMLRRDRSERGRQASDARWAPKAEQMEKAIAIARAKPFSKWTDVARAIQAEITKTPDGTEVYTEVTIISWLKAAGLTRTKNQ